MNQLSTPPERVLQNEPRPKRSFLSQWLEQRALGRERLGMRASELRSSLLTQCVFSVLVCCVRHNLQRSYLRPPRSAQAGQGAEAQDEVAAAQ
jgi:hypothetical protein